MTALTDWKAEQASLWGGGAWREFGEHVLAPCTTNWCAGWPHAE
jgi:hypothetical protein